MQGPQDANGPAGPAGPQGPVGATGPQGPSGPVTMTRSAQTYDVPAHGVAAMQAGCPATSAITGGGYSFSNLHTGVIITSNYPFFNGGTWTWVVTATNTTNSPVPVTTHALCATGKLQ